MTPLTGPNGKPPIKRSRAGCASCKKLRIKCDEAKPKCEYCTHTNRKCVYPKPTSSNDNIGLVAQASKIVSSLDVIERELRIKEMLHVRRTQLDSQVTFSQLTSLNQVSSQLSISTFELRLLKFFDDYCMTLLSFGMNESVHNVWKNYVPSLFLESELVRDSIYAFSAINMFPLCNVDLVKEQDDLHESMQVDGARGISYHSAIRADGLEESIYVTTTKYFMSSIKKTNSIISSNLTDPYGHASFSNKTAKELVISSILTFTFLAIHPHRLIPLVDFSESTESRNDYLSICKGIRATFIACGPKLTNDEFKGLTGYSNDGGFNGLLKDSTYPLIVKLKRDLDELYESNEFDSAVAEEYDTLFSVLDMYNRGMHTSAMLNYPVPLFRCISLYPAHFHQLIYEKNFFALRLLYIFAGLATIREFQLFEGSSMWLDYMNWYKQYNFEMFFNTWKYKMDEDFYTIAMDNTSFRYADYSYLSTFDPVIP
ncbi:uncharacterized protein RJT20DRAFT_40535 [Scheffersomyces xylosifermentans]|uniref:uncharacterized protein n=1 Tax=Scheffersomyces xylosifermentans TaxID=1304137 RepID=UPI00315C6F5C